MGLKTKRRRLVVDPGMQFRLVLRIGWYLLLWTVIAFHASFVFYLCGEFLVGGAQRGFARLYLDYFGHEKPLLTILAVMTPLVLYDVLKFSNRISGPLYRCRRLMLEMAAGKPVPEFTAREHDFMEAVFVDFNTLIRAWNARIDSERQAEREADKRVPEEATTPVA
jgi:hypothetical protein